MKKSTVVTDLPTKRLAADAVTMFGYGFEPSWVDTLPPSYGWLAAQDKQQKASIQPSKPGPLYIPPDYIHFHYKEYMML